MPPHTTFMFTAACAIPLLCGRNERTGQRFEHRRKWIEERPLELTQVFALDVCAYAVMSNHYHVVLHINPPEAANWKLREVIERWHQLFKGSSLSQRYLRGETLGSAELNRLLDVAEIWRERLMDISWFMRYLNECIAHETNRDGRCTDRFWDESFKSRALLDEKALVDWTPRCLREDKRGAIPEQLPPILERLQIDARHWLYLNQNFVSRLKTLIGSAHVVRYDSHQLDKRWAHGIRDGER